MSSRTAVLLCGEVRTWLRASTHIFEFIERFYNNVDYYFITWSTSSEYWPNKNIRTSTQKKISDDDILPAFEGRRLIAVKILDMSIMNSTDHTYLCRAKLAKVANILKRRYELANDFVYDQVFELRPDLYIKSTGAELIECGDFEYVAAPIYSHLCQLHSLPDLYIKSNSFGNDIISDRGYSKTIDDLRRLEDIKIIDDEYEPMPDTRDPHWMLLKFLYGKRMIQIHSSEGATATALRPNFPDGFDKLPIEEIRNLAKEYMKYITG